MELGRAGWGDEERLLLVDSLARIRAVNLSMLRNLFLGSGRSLRRRNRHSGHRRASLESLEPRWAPATVELAADLITMGPSYPNSLIEYNGALYFHAHTYSDGQQWWRLDGAGDVALASDTTPRSGFSHHAQAAVYNGELYLPFQPLNTGRFPLYKIDTQGEFQPAVAGDDWLDTMVVEHLTVFADAIFYAGGAFEDRELWRGDAGGNHRPIANIHPGGSSRPSELTVVGDALYFSADDGIHGRELWKSDAAGNVELVADILAGGESSNPERLTLFSGELYFWAQRAAGGDYALWKLDAEGHAQQAADLYAPGIIAVRPGMTEFDGRLHVFAADATGAKRLWRLDGQGNVELAANISAGGHFLESMIVFHDELYFRGYDSQNGYELWKLDRSGGSTPVTNFGREAALAFGDPRGFEIFEDALYFAASEEADNMELWRIDAEGAVTIAADVEPGSSLPEGFAAFGDRLYFSAQVPAGGRRAWTIDGGGHVELTLDMSGWHGSFPGYTASNGDLYFGAGNSETGSELWKLEAPDEASLVADIWRGAGSSFPRELTEAHGTVYFSASDEAHGNELWKLDAQDAVSLVADVWPGPDGSWPRQLAALGDSLYFTAFHKDLGDELWRLDLQDRLTVIDINPGQRSSQPVGLTAYRGELYFSAEDATGNRGLRKVNSDGNVQRVGDMTPASWFNAHSFVAFNNALSMVAYATEGGVQLWKMNSEEQFRQVTQIRSEAVPAISSAGWVFANALYFTANDGVHGEELWKLDTQDQATLVADIYPGPGHSRPRDFAEFNGAL
ncbi:MAG: hypothetical protein KY475_05325, partial [Planctomycetes bacterium]|nr:hypothetical protein [Planctomycetota bacterium]